MINVSAIEFTRRLLKSGGISLKGILFLPLYYIQMIPGLPFALLQFILYGRQIRKTRIYKDPVFILGHYRSGTTLLQKLLVSNKNFGSLTNYDALFPNTNMIFGNLGRFIFQKIIQVFRIKNPFFHESIVQLTDPAEEDDYLMNRASAYTAYWGLVFPKRWHEWLNGEKQFTDPEYNENWEKEYLHTIRYATYRNKGKQLVLKNPPNTERIGKLLKLFPGAKFIYIRRDPFELYFSVKNMWKNAILRYYSVQKLTDQELDDLIFGHFTYITTQYEIQKNRISKGNLIEVTYEELMEDPFNTVKMVYDGLNLSGFEQAESALMERIEKEKAYKGFSHVLTDSSIQKIKEKWGQ